MPLFGGFCADGVALGKLFPVDISTAQVRDGKLYLNLNPDILKKFNADLGGNVIKADKNWPSLVKQNALLMPTRRGWTQGDDHAANIC